MWGYKKQNFKILLDISLFGIIIAVEQIEKGEHGKSRYHEKVNIKVDVKKVNIEKVNIEKVNIKKSRHHEKSVLHRKEEANENR